MAIGSIIRDSRVDAWEGLLLGVGSLVAAVFIIRVSGVNSALRPNTPKGSMSPHENSGMERA